MLHFLTDIVDTSVSIDLPNHVIENILNGICEHSFLCYSEQKAFYFNSICRILMKLCPQQQLNHEQMAFHADNSIQLLH